MKTKVNLIISPKTRKEYLRVKSILINKGFKLSQISGLLAHYWNNAGSCISLSRGAK